MGRPPAAGLAAHGVGGRSGYRGPLEHGLSRPLPVARSLGMGGTPSPLWWAAACDPIISGAPVASPRPSWMTCRPRSRDLLRPWPLS
eukprot:8171555-Alexandrium_andersonii.AAC.1